jgi:hypothetical protein
MTCINQEGCSVYGPGFDTLSVYNKCHTKWRNCTYACSVTAAFITRKKLTLRRIKTGTLEESAGIRLFFVTKLTFPLRKTCIREKYNYVIHNDIITSTLANVSRINKKPKYETFVDCSISAGSPRQNKAILFIITISTSSHNALAKVTYKVSNKSLKLQHHFRGPTLPQTMHPFFRE